MIIESDVFSNCLHAICMRQYVMYPSGVIFIHSENLTAVNEQALALLKKLNVQPQDNFLSQSLQVNAEVKALFETGLGIFKAHESHSEMMVEELK